ncbi:MAG: glycosyl transferase [Fulvimarina manganoxydans]|uniref:glycosyltransferase family protein n=1 Tax=Fulvimarina manganoxydans TaxID=937218 RepID=UPI0023544801|nr:glycosyltransferase [Fulvimarina manganoxydans]MCK5931534.1 glycosyl transferase [Fulvimarina manganoxydans]
MRVLFHVQHLLGVGHLRRAELITEALADKGAEVTVALGGHPVPEIAFSRSHVVQLPPTHIRGADFKTLYDEADRPIDEAWRERRRDALLDLYRAVRPDMVLLELYPFGRWRFGFELEPLLELASQDKPKVKCVASVRDILVETKRPERLAKGLEIAKAHLDAVLVHSDPALFPFGETYPHADEIADITRYTGYVTEPAKRGSGEPTGDVIVSAGGGAAAGDLMQIILDARPLTALSDRVWRLYTGPRCSPEAFEALKERSGPTVLIERFASDFQARLDRAALSISQAGYNTVMNLLRAEVPAVVVPYDEGEETEQIFRARRLEALGHLTVLPTAQLSPETMAEAIGRTLARPQNLERRPIDLEGAGRTANILMELAGSA